MAGGFHTRTPPLWLLLPWEQGELGGRQRWVTHQEAKHGRFTRIISAGEITAHTYRNPWAERYHPAPQTPKQQGSGGASGSGFGKFS